MVQPIATKYVASSANTTIELGADTVELRAGTVTAVGSGTACLDLAKKERVVIDVETDFNGFDVGTHSDIEMKFGPRGQFVPAIAVKSQMTGSGARIQLVVNGSDFVQVRDKRVRLLNAIVHVLNFPEFFCLGGDGTDFRYAHQRLGRVVLKNPEWEVELQALPSTHAVVEQLKAEGGNAITHVARIARVDRRVFTCGQLTRVVLDLQRFLSFARGTWAPVFGAVGFDRSGCEIYEDWSDRISAPWQVCRSWFDIHHGEALAVAFPGFVRLMHDPALGRAGYAALYWYLRSNRAGDGPGVDGGLILSQAALEGLSMSVLSQAGVSIPGKPPAARKIRAACQLLDIATTIPHSSKVLRAWQKRGMFEDGPDAVTKVRNDLVHPERRLSGKLPPVVSQAWDLSQWYIEVMLLRLCQYQGTYSHRLTSKWVGEVQPFP